MDGHHLGDREGTEGQNPAYGRLTVNHRPCDRLVMSLWECQNLSPWSVSLLASEEVRAWLDAGPFALSRPLVVCLPWGL